MKSDADDNNYDNDQEPTARIATNKELVNKFKFHTFLLLKDQTYHYQIMIMMMAMMTHGWLENDDDDDDDNDASDAG